MQRDQVGAMLDLRLSEAKLVMFEHWDVANLQVMKIIRFREFCRQEMDPKWHDLHPMGNNEYL